MHELLTRCTSGGSTRSILQVPGNAYIRPIIGWVDLSEWYLQLDQSEVKARI